MNLRSAARGSQEEGFTQPRGGKFALLSTFLHRPGGALRELRELREEAAVVLTLLRRRHLGPLVVLDVATSDSVDTPHRHRT